MEQTEKTKLWLNRISWITLSFTLCGGLTRIIVGNIEKFSYLKDSSIAFTLISGFFLIISLTLSFKYGIAKMDSFISRMEGSYTNLQEATLSIEGFHKELKDLIREETIRMVSHLPVTTTIVKDPLKREFVDDIYYKFGQRLIDISNGSISEDDPHLYHRFAMQLFNLVSENGVIHASSNVDPSGFWEDDTIGVYLANNKRLIVERNVKFLRYFFIDKYNRESAKIAIAKNIRAGAQVFVIDKNRNPNLVIDGGRIDSKICLESILDKNLQILKVHAYFKEHTNFRNLSSVVDKWESVGVKATDFYKINEEGFMKLLK